MANLQFSDADGRPVVNPRAIAYVQEHLGRTGSSIVFNNGQQLHVPFQVDDVELLWRTAMSLPDPALVRVTTLTGRTSEVRNQISRSDVGTVHSWALRAAKDTARRQQSF